jgi:tetratricopeptide (TPR) repeat protein
MSRAARFFLWPLFFSAFLMAGNAADFDLAKAKALFIKGDYDNVIEQAEAAIKARERGEDWPMLQAEALWMTGQYPKAKEAIKSAQRYNYYSVRIRLLAWKIYRSAGDTDAARAALDEINSLGSNRRWGYRDPLDLIALGEAAVLMNADPRIVLDNFFQPVKKSDPKMREVYLAIGNLALQKHDFALAGKSFGEGLKQLPGDPDLLAGMAAALSPSDRKEMLNTLEEVFQANPNHIAARLLLVEHLVDAEEYGDAEKELEKIEAVNPNRPEMWAYRAVIDHLRNNFEKEKEDRERGLKYWPANPEVDYIIGRKLSQKYRFAEGADYQRQAMKFDITFLPAQTQLAQDLLRLGDEDDGWRLAERVNKMDGYDVTAYNLVTLHDSMNAFVTLTNADFILRMSAHEADVYGAEALNLLERARTNLTRKYGLDLKIPTTVEIFPQQKDFAVRTFGIPGQEGYLGVCFGNVITANSPAIRTMNWNSVLWHEFCHVITLNLTKNKMPRWLSEGISVYEERRAEPRWGEQMNPEYREMILDGKMKPIDDMSSAFMAPPSGTYLQFAYYQSSLVVEFLVERYGLDSLRAILKDLGEGKEINKAIAAHTDSLDHLQKDFEAFAKSAAENFGPDSVWEKPKRDGDGAIELTWAASHTNNFFVVRDKAGRALERGNTNEAIQLLERCVKLYPGQRGADTAYAELAAIYRSRNQAESEREILRQWARSEDEAAPALRRLLQLDGDDPKLLRRDASDLLQINPLISDPYEALAKADEKSGDKSGAIQNYKTVLKLDPDDPAEAHFHLARLFEGSDSQQARRHILLALEEAPRYRAAHKLLLKIESEEGGNEKISRDSAEREKK